MTTGRIFIDTNLLLLLLVVTASEAHIAAHRRTRAYTVDDFALLKLLIADATALVTTPNVLAEASNLMRQSDQSRLAPILDVFRSFAAAASETYVRSAQAVGSADFARLGMNDVTILEAQDPDMMLITDDLHLYRTSAMAGSKVLNFTHERERLLG